jgi:uncharacterized protein
VKLVVDTNTLISGLLWSGPSALLLEAAAQGKVILVLSPQLLTEFSEVILRPKFIERILTKQTTPDDLARKLGHEAIMVSPAALPLPLELRDPKDLHVLECAVSGEADAIVTGDEDLLIMESFKEIPIMNAREALRRLGLI